MFRIIEHSRCPHCNYLLDSRDANAIIVKYESPFKSCPKCRNNYIDKSCIELAIQDPPKDKRALPTQISILAFFMVIGILSAISGNIILFIVMLVLSGIFAAAFFIPGKNARFEEERKNSEARLSNPAYAAALKSLGYPVPLKYLDPVKYEKIKAFENIAPSNCVRCGLYLRSDQFRKRDGQIYCNSCYNIAEREKNENHTN